jgi:hypothetical protein
VKKLLKDNRGGGYLTACVITIAISMILAVVLFYAQCMTIIQTTRADTERVLESFVMKNSIDIYNSIKQGHDFTEEFDENFYISETSSELSLDYSQKRLYNYGADGKIVYSMTNPNVTYKVDKALKLKASYTVMIPVVFAGEYLFDLEIPITVTRSLTLKE